MRSYWVRGQDLSVWFLRGSGSSGLLSGLSWGIDDSDSDEQEVLLLGPLFSRSKDVAWLPWGDASDVLFHEG